MHVLIVVSDRKLGMVWKQHLLAARCRVDLVAGQDAAVAVLERADVRVIVLDLGLAEGSAFAVAELCQLSPPRGQGRLHHPGRAVLGRVDLPAHAECLRLPARADAALGSGGGGGTSLPQQLNAFRPAFRARAARRNPAPG